MFTYTIFFIEINESPDNSKVYVDINYKESNMKIIILSIKENYKIMNIDRYYSYIMHEELLIV